MAERDVNNNTSHHGHNKQKKTCKAVMVFTPFLLLIMCVGIVVLFGMKDFRKLTGYADMLFRQNSGRDYSYKDNEYRVSDAEHIKGKTQNTNTEEEHEIHFPYVGDVYAHLTIKNDEANIKNVPVIWGLSDSMLERGVCEANYGCYIGDTGRVVLAGHNHTYFYGLPKVKVGDICVLTTSYGKFTYKVKYTKILDENDTSLLFYNPADENVTDDLVMYTCWNNGMLGMSTDRLYYVCSVVSKEWNN